MPVHRPPVIRSQDRIDVRLTEEAEYRVPFTFIEALNEGTLADRPAHAFLDAARERRLFHVLNRTTDNIIGTGVIQLSSESAQQAEVGGLMFHPGARGFGLAALFGSSSMRMTAPSPDPPRPVIISELRSIFRTLSRQSTSICSSSNDLF